MDINYVYIKKVRNVDSENYLIKFEVINSKENYSCQSQFKLSRDISHLIHTKISVRGISTKFNTVYELLEYILKEY